MQVFTLGVSNCNVELRTSNEMEFLNKAWFVQI